jgi:hypothetical protein
MKEGGIPRPLRGKSLEKLSLFSSHWFSYACSSEQEPGEKRPTKAVATNFSRGTLSRRQGPANTYGIHTVSLVLLHRQHARTYRLDEQKLYCQR